MQEDFPCIGDTNSYEMNIESDDQMRPRQEKSTSSKQDSFINKKEVDMTCNKKAIIDLENSIKLSLSTNITREKILLDNIQSIDQNTEQSLEDDGQVQNDESNHLRLSISSKFLHEDQKITSIVVIKLQNECFNVRNEMYLTNKLENNTTLSSKREFSNNILTQQNLQSLPDNSGKKSKNYNLLSMRKVSNNSNDSDTTQPLVQNLCESSNSNIEFQCYNCGISNIISNDNIQRQQYLLKPTCQTTSYIDFSQQSIENKQQTHNQKISKYIKQNYQSSSKIFNPLTHKTKSDDDQGLLSYDKQKLNLKNKIKSSRRRIEISTQQVKITPKQINYNKSTTLSNNNQENDRTDKQNNLEQSVSVEGLNGVYNNLVLQKDKSLQASQKLISTAQLVQTESSFNKFFNLNNNKEFVSVIPSSNENLIQQNIQVCNKKSDCKENNNSYSIFIKESNDVQHSKNKNFKKTNLSHKNISLQNIQSNQLQQQEKITSQSNNNKIHERNSFKISHIPKYSSQAHQKLYSNSQINFQSDDQLSNPQQRSEIIVENHEIKIDDIINKSVQFDKNDQIENQIQESYIGYQEKEQTCSEDQEESQIYFSDETIAQTEKKNVVKNFVKAFMSDVKKDQSQLNNINTSSNSQISLAQKFKKFNNYMKKQQFNNKFFKKLINDCEYSQIFQQFLLYKADDWLKTSNVKNKETHRQMLLFFKKSIDHIDELNKLKVLKKNKRIVNSNYNKALLTPNTVDTVQISSNSQAIREFSPGFTEQHDIDFVSIIEKQIYQQQIVSQETIQDLEKQQQQNQNELQQQNHNQIENTSINSIQNVLNGIQINNPSL